MTPHQKDIVRALKKVPANAEFCAGDLKKLYGYPHSNSSQVLQQDTILLNFVTYADPSYRNGKIWYKLHPDFDTNEMLYGKIV